MTLAAGTRLGTYEVTGSIGAGGMGEVYRARDLKLDRDVALKILPSAFAADPDRLARFEREAKTLAALNHPLIAQIYGIEDSTDVRALVMELVEGETLDARIGALSVDEALALAKQIAEALQAAHEQGIIHRDLKPANIKVRSDGTIKVLDFGLAKPSVEAGAASGSGGAAGIDGLTQSPTLTLAATQAGIILGTAGYMSPEQAKGRAADKRSDVWSFGCVLFEMLSGRRAFEGEDVSDTLASVLKSEPDWSALPADVPSAIKTLLQRCLVKDRRSRVADVSVVQFVLAEASTLIGPPEGGPHGDHVDHGPAKAGHYVRLVALVSALVLVAAGLAAFTAWRLKPSPSLPISRFAITPPDGQQVPVTGRQVLALSPDGKQLVYSVGDRLYIRALADLQAHAIPGSDSVGGALVNPVFSPDSSSVAFFTLVDGTLKRLATTGGVPLTICRTESVVYGMSWDASGIVFGAGSRGVFRCPVSGGTAERIATVKENEQAHGPQILPGGKSVLFTLAQMGDGAERWEKAQVIVESLTSHERTTVVHGGSDARYVPTGHLLYAQRGVVFAVPFDPGRPTSTGTAVPVIEGVRRALNATTGVAQFDTSVTGTLVYIPGPTTTQSGDRRIARADRAGMIAPLPMQAGQYVHARVSRDGTRLALDRDTGNDASVWIYEMSGASAIRQLTFAGKNRFPIWSPDGQHVAFQSNREGVLGIFAQRADGTGAIERLTKPGQGDAHIPESWSPDGRHISFSILKDSKYALSILSVSDRKIEPFGNVRSAEPPGSVFSPDGRWLAYHFVPETSASGSDGGVFVQPFPVTGEIHQAPKIERDFQPVWSRDGTELFYVPFAAAGRLAAVRVTTRPGVSFGSPQSIPTEVIAGRTSSLTRAFDTLPDGKFIGPISASESGPATLQGEMRVVLNWFEELKARVPATR